MSDANSSPIAFLTNRGTAFGVPRHLPAASQPRKPSQFELRQYLSVLLFVCILCFSCGTLEKKTILLNPGDVKQRVLDVMGTPRDRQFQGTAEAWQYCQTGAGFGYHDYRVVWFRNGKVTGITSYKDYTPASSCAGHLREVRWEDAPDYTLEIRNR